MRRPCPGSLQSNKGDRRLSINTETVPIVMILQRRSTEYGEDIMGTYSNFRKERSKRSAKVP